MNISSIIEQQTPRDIRLSLKDRIRQRRKEQKLSQAALAEKSDVSLGSIKRFERTGEIALTSLIKIAIALGYEDNFDQLFAQRHYHSIEDVIADAATK